MENLTTTEMQTLLEQASSESPSTGKLLKYLCDQLDEKEGRVVMLENRVFDLEMRMTEVERYSSKDCVIIENLPYDLNVDLAMQATDFLNTKLKMQLSPQGLKACHFLSNPTIPGKPAAVILKFIYFSDKDLVWRKKKLLSGMVNKSNNKPVWIHERLPKVDREVQKHANDHNLVTITENCAVKILVPDSSGENRSIEVRSKKEVDDQVDCAVKKRSSNKLFNFQNRDKNAASQTPSTSATKRGLQKMKNDDIISLQKLLEKCKCDEERIELFRKFSSVSPASKSTNCDTSSSIDITEI